MSRVLPGPRARLWGAACVLSLVATGCQASGGASAPAGSESSSPGASATPTEPPVPPVRVSTNLGGKTKQVLVSTALRVRAEGGTLRRVVVAAGDVRLPGKVAADGRSWRATGRLEPGLDYVVRSTAVRADGEVRHRTARFRTQDLTLDQQTYPSVAPLQGETVGIGMPVIVSFDVAVQDKAAFEKHMTVTSTPRQRGSWFWISDHEAHWRPATYWKAGTDVTVDVGVNSVPAGNGIFGQEDRSVRFHVGDATILRVNAQTYQMTVTQNGQVLRTIPITTGKPGFTTRSGTKVIMEKHLSKRMNSETVGISEGDPEFYDIDDVEYAMRLTHSGEFIHAAPWSVGSQGYANVSHGCTGMSTANAGWLYSITRRGDVVEYTGTDRWMTMTNGYGDWNVPFADYRKGSAL